MRGEHSCEGRQSSKRRGGEGGEGQSASCERPKVGGRGGGQDTIETYIARRRHFSQTDELTN